MDRLSSCLAVTGGSDQGKLDSAGATNGRLGDSVKHLSGRVDYRYFESRLKR